MTALLTALFTLLLVSAGIGTFAYTITKASLFEPSRDWLLGSTRKWVVKIGEFLSCTYCAAHWPALAVAPFLHLLPLPRPILIPATWLALTGIAVIFARILHVSKMRINLDM